MYGLWKANIWMQVLELVHYILDESDFCKMYSCNIKTGFVGQRYILPSNRGMLR